MIKKPEFKQKKLCSWSKNTANHYNAAEPFSQSDSYGVGFVLKYPKCLSVGELCVFQSSVYRNGSQKEAPTAFIMIASRWSASTMLMHALNCRGSQAQSVHSTKGNISSLL